MPELRKDPIIGRWVIIATERGKRPKDYYTVPAVSKGTDNCPFCPTREDQTPPEILAFRPTPSKPNEAGWTLRVVPNKFPALRIEGDLNREGVGVFDKMNGVGAHEVIVETTDHYKDIFELPDKAVEDVIWSYLKRTTDLKNDPRFRYILIFKNQGEAAGASLEHPHSQLIATPIVPKRVTEELSGAKQYYNYKERCIFCDIVRQELEEKVRVVCQNDSFLAIEPFAPRFPFETWILPKQHNSAFEDIPEKKVLLLAKILKETLARICIGLNRPPYNYIVHTAPIGNHKADEYHWHFEIMPILTKVAGFEWGTGFFINPTSPEEAAQFLREVQL